MTNYFMQNDKKKTHKKSRKKILDLIKKHLVKKIKIK
jgi:hypothetical protein